MQILIELMKSIVACLPVFLLLLAVKKLNLKKVERHRQFPMPFVALVYALVLALVLLYLNQKIKITMVDTGEEVGCIHFWLNYSIEQKAECIRLWVETKLAEYAKVTGTSQSGTLESVRQVIDTILSNVLQVVENLAETVAKYIMAVVNTLMVVAYLAVKAIALRLVCAKWKKDSLVERTSGFFYEKDEDTKLWVLQESNRDFRLLMKAFYLAAFVVGIGLSALSMSLYQLAPFQVVLFPVLGALVLGEVYFFLCGYTATEYQDEVLGEDSFAQRNVNLTKLREALRDLFGERLLVESSGIASPRQQGISDVLEEMTNVNADQRERVAGSYFRVLQQSGKSLDVDKIRSATRMLYGENVLYYNPFYKDLTDYLMLPITYTLMNRRKVLVIAGRKSTEPQIKGWIESALQDYLKMSGLWRVGSVGQIEPFEVGILPFSQLYDLDLLTGQRAMFHQVGLVLILEPSLVLATGQIGLELVADYCDEEGEKTTYCICDRNCDGLVDSMSHVLKQSILNVVATESPTGVHSEMCWNGDGAYFQRKILPDISRYLGVGTELAAVAAREQTPRISWHSEGKFPVAEMKWIAGQYYDSLCHFAHIPMSQQSVYDAIDFVPDLWGTEKEKYRCLIVEDEFCNLLEVVRTFQTRGTDQVFVNVISENYLLRDYMQDNYRLFDADRKAIPTVVADFAHTRRNTTLRLLMLLLTNENLSENQVKKELRLVGVNGKNTCADLNRLIRYYCDVGSGDYVGQLLQSESALDFDFETENQLYLRKEKRKELEEKLAGGFCTAYYVTEDEKEQSSFMDARLLGQIYQAILPGQFFTYDGKYYQVVSVTATKGVLVRRAADHIVGRRYYRQKRRYRLTNLTAGNQSRVVSGITVTEMDCNLQVHTDSYFELEGSNNLQAAREILCPGKDGKENPYFRSYRHKHILRVKLPGADESVRYTAALLLSEIFRTVYADAWPYLAVVTPQTEKTADCLRGILYALEGSDTGLEEDCLYILEDSDLDMGLLQSVERNMERLLGILADFLNWHMVKAVEKDPEPEPPQEVQVTVVNKPTLLQRILYWFRKLFRRIGNFFRKLFHRPLKPYPPEQSTRAERKAKKKAEKEALKAKKKAEKEAKKAAKDKPNPPYEQPVEQPADPSVPQPVSQEGPVAETPTNEPVDPEATVGVRPAPNAPAEEPEELPTEEPAAGEAADGENATEENAPEAPAEENPAEEEDNIEKPDFPQQSGFILRQEAPGEQRPPEDIDGTDAQATREEGTEKKNKYLTHCFLNYGYGDIDGSLALAPLSEYLNGLHFDENELKDARVRETEIDVDATELAKEETCDFCGKRLSGVAYDVLNDGRVRCCGCSASAITTVEQFRRLYRQVLPGMEALYHIRISVPVRVRMVDARTIAKRGNAVYTPTSGFDARTVGFAQMDKEGYSLYVENGAPRLATMETIAHELTHIWQFTNWDRAAMEKKYGNSTSLDVVYEGMAMWCAIQFLYLMGESEFARQKEQQTLLRQDAYGQGFRLYCKKYPLSRGASLPPYTPFHTNPPL